MTIRPGALRLVAGLGALALASETAAYVRASDQGTGKDLFWPTSLVPYRVSDAPPMFQSPSCTAGPAGDPALGAAQSAFSAWEQSCSSLRLVFAGQIPDTATGLDGGRENLVVFRRGWCSANPQAAACMATGATDCGNVYDCFEDHGPSDKNIVALTSALYDPDTGRMINADIEVNGWDGQGSGTALSTTAPPHGWYFTCDKQAAWPECTTYGQPGCFYVDLQNTLTHEAGHFVGLAHPCGDPGEPACTTAYANTTMYPVTTPGDLAKRTLSPDDVAGVCAIYPVTGGCACGSGGGGGVAAGLLALAALRRRRRAQATTIPA